MILRQCHKAQVFFKELCSWEILETLTLLGRGIQGHFASETRWLMPQNVMPGNSALSAEDLSAEKVG
jgi:hypothetical protein